MKLSKAEREQVRAKYNGHCAYCGVELGKVWHADHFEAVQRKLIRVPGKGLRTTGEMYRPENHRLDNMMPACAPCNISKADFPLDYWRRQLAHHVEALHANHKSYRMAKLYGLVTETGKPVVFYFETLKPTPAVGVREEVPESRPDDPIRLLIAEHTKLIEAGNSYAYFELAYTRQTGWAAWLCSKPHQYDPGRKVLAQGLGDTPDEACADALLPKT